MPRELEGYRPQLELLTDMFPGRAAIGITECQAALGIDRRTLLADRRFPARHVGNKYTVSLTEKFSCTPPASWAAMLI